MKRNFSLWHSVSGAAVLVILEGLLLVTLKDTATLQWAVILLSALVGGVAHVYVATEVIEEVRSARHMLILLSAVVAIFILFFTVQYWYLLSVLPQSYTGLENNPVDLLLHSTMVFVFNPLYLPTNMVARTLLLINTLGGLALALFILQNIWQIRSNKN